MRALLQLAVEGCFVAGMLLAALALRLLRHFLRPSARASSPAASAELVFGQTEQLKRPAFLPGTIH
jgi:hypothetical protein